MTGPHIIASATDVVDPGAWEGLGRTIGGSNLIVFLIVAIGGGAFLFAVRAVFGKRGLAARVVDEITGTLSATRKALEESSRQHRRQAALCRRMANMHAPGGPCHVQPLIQAAHPAAAAVKKIADKVGADVEGEIRELHAALDGRKTGGSTT